MLSPNFLSYLILYLFPKLHNLPYAPPLLLLFLHVLMLTGLQDTFISHCFTPSPISYPLLTISRFTPSPISYPLLTISPRDSFRAIYFTPSRWWQWIPTKCCCLLLPNYTASHPKTVNLTVFAVGAPNLAFSNQCVVNITYVFSEVIDITLSAGVQITLFLFI